MKPGVKNNYSILQDDFTVHNSILYHLHATILCYMIHLINPSHQLVFTLSWFSSCCSKLRSSSRYSHYTGRGARRCRIFQYFKKSLCEYNVSSFLIDIEIVNLSSEYNETNSLRSAVLGSNHSDDNDFVDVCDDKFPSASANLSMSNEYFNLDL